jgi:hypothetical protein
MYPESQKENTGAIFFNVDKPVETIDQIIDLVSKDFMVRVTVDLTYVPPGAYTYIMLQSNSYKFFLGNYTANQVAAMYFAVAYVFYTLSILF